MKTVKVFLIVAVVAIVATVFVACRKNDNNDVANATNPAPVNNYVEPQKNFDEAYITELIASTGIDIYEVSKYEGIQKMADKNLKMISAFNAANVALQTKGTLTDAKFTQIQNLATTIQSKYNEGNYEEVLILYESLCDVCMTIDGFMFDVNEHGLQTITYDPDKESLQLPVNQLETERANAVELIRTVEERNPQFPSLPEATRIDILAAAVYVNMQQNTIMTKAAQDCKKNAHDEMIWSLSKATAAYLGGSLLCGGTLILYIACQAVVTAAYVDTVLGIEKLYDTRIQLCNKQGYY